MCESCGHAQWMACDKRRMGTGRRHDINWRPGPNHNIIQRFLRSHPNMLYTVSTLRLDLNVASVKRTPGRHDRREYWWDEDVQNVLSDLVGVGTVDALPPTRGRELCYKTK